MVTTFSIFGPVFSESVVWVTIAFIIFFILFGRRLWRVLAGMLDKRANAVRTELAEALKLREEAEAMLKDAEARRASALADAKTLLASAQAEAERLREAAAADAKESAKRREKMAVQRIAAAEKAAVADVRIAAMEVASAAAIEVIREGLDTGTDAALINHAIVGLPAALRRKAA